MHVRLTEPEPVELGCNDRAHVRSTVLAAASHYRAPPGVSSYIGFDGVGSRKCTAPESEEIPARSPGSIAIRKPCGRGRLEALAGGAGRICTCQVTICGMFSRAACAGATNAP